MFFASEYQVEPRKHKNKPQKKKKKQTNKQTNIWHYNQT